MGYFKGRLGSCTDLRNLGSGGPNLGLPFAINPASITLAVTTGKEWYDQLASKFSVDDSWKKMKEINKVGRVNKKTNLCKRADWSCLSQFSIIPGERLNVLGGSQNWLYVQNMNGIVGYVPRDDVTGSAEDIPSKGSGGAEDLRSKGGGMGALIPVGLAIALLNQ